MAASAPQLRAFLQTFPEKTFKKGEDIFEESRSNRHREDGIELTGKGPRSAGLLVPSQGAYGMYEVKVSWTAARVTGRCSCLAFQDYGPCKHIVAATLFLIDEAATGPDIEDAEIISESKTPVSRTILPEHHEKVTITIRPAGFFKSFGWQVGGYAISKAELRKIVKMSVQEPECVWDFTYRQAEKKLYYPRIEYDRHESFRLSCTCDNIHSLCPHLITTFNYLLTNYGAGYFSQFKDVNAEKTAALAQIGLSPDDPEAADISFDIDAWGNLNMRVPEWLWFPSVVESRTAQMAQRLGLKAPEASPAQDQTIPHAGTFVPAIVFQMVTSNLPFPFELSVVNVANGKFVKLSTSNAEKLPELKAAIPRAVYDTLIDMSGSHLNRLLAAEGYYEQLPNSIRHMRMDDRPTIFLLRAYATALSRLWPWLSTSGVEIFSTSETRITRAQSSPIRLHPEPVTARVFAAPAGKFTELIIRYYEQSTGTELSGRLQQVSGLLLRQDDNWYLPADDSTRSLMRQFPSGFIKIPAAAEESLMQRILPSLRSRYDVVLDESLQPLRVHLPPETSLHLSESGGKYLVLTPVFAYSENRYHYDAHPDPILEKTAAGQWQEIIRDEPAEKTFAETIRDLHPSFAAGDRLQSFSLSFAEALRDSWYQKMLAALAEQGVAVTGQDKLQHFRYNPNEAKVSVSSTGESSGSGIDWFDLLIGISFGDQQASLKEVRRALMQGQAGVRLDDGTIGLLPEAFVAQYGMLLKLGKEEKDDTLRLNKLHFTLIDSLHEALLSKDMSAEIAAKKDALKNIENIRTSSVPEAINATLRPYQVAGYQWMQVLDKLGWGGCLADDMGLGKTLQTITFLQHLKSRKPTGVHLIVCPTSLVYNWQAELDKFAPDLRYHIHYGAGRLWDPALLAQMDIVITTYGTVRSDLVSLTQVAWQYVILDESQTIKNPDAQTTKAVQTLPAKNRLCLSGTPLQNNTYDLYAQFQFLNPGLLGSRDFFRTEFATPIDKRGEEGPRATLRRMLSPFMLRRTKEQVAKDLPDKTEAILWCEMEPAQRAVYDEYRRYYRDSLLKRIDDEGMAGSAIYVLEALLRLRQLCDHPGLVRNKSVKTTDSIKLDELRREIRENAGGRKLLIFSQFTQMLAKIAEALTEDGVRFVYLDGKTPAAKRNAAVEQFQSDPDVQVFLISLKAGGVGLNLTAAEYVYLVDPWWNPAVEAQAIDRTHRIGQTNKIVAYRMICKDTVEEKVMLLQSRKRALAEGLVTEDAGFVKKLTRDDVAFLLE